MATPAGSGVSGRAAAAAAAASAASGTAFVVAALLDVSVTVAAPRPDPAVVLIGAVLAGALLGRVVARQLHSPLGGSPDAHPTTERRRRMARRKSSEYRREATADPFELELEKANDDGSPVVVTFRSPNDLENETAFDIALEEDPRRSLEQLLGDDWPVFWAEWRRRRVGELNELLADVMEHYGAERGKLVRSRR